MLLLSICPVGSLFMGSSKATRQGTIIFQSLHKAILASVGETARSLSNKTK